MDFFDRQDHARRRTLVLVLYLVLAIVLIAVALNAVVYALLLHGEIVAPDLGAWLREPWWLVVSAVTLAIVVIGSIARYLKLRGGGKAIAEMVGARALDHATSDRLERRLINVVEEMSIAAGTPVPSLYVLDEEQGINAFVAGFEPTEAVLVVTKGALESLNRDELQGVVGHEFSHILNGDMRLNVRLMAILAGILSIGAVGRVLLRSGSSSRRRRSRKRSGSGGVAILGLAMVVLGYIGVFFGRLIKAAVSRQREFLADASSVQFTRNSDGIAGALWRIRQHTVGSVMEGDHAEDTSHMCFGASLRLSKLLATHPPVDDRIHAIDPQFKGKQAARRIKESQTRAPPAPAPVPGVAAGFAAGGVEPIQTSTSAVVASVGSPQPQHMDYAKQLHASLPCEVMGAVHRRESVSAVIFALLLGEVKVQKRQVGVALIRHREGEREAEQTVEMLKPILRLDARARLPIVDLAMPTLRGLEPDYREQLLGTVDKLVRVDAEVSLFEFVVITLLEKHLRDPKTRSAKARYFKFQPVMAEIRKLLTLVANAGAETPGDARVAFQRAAAGFGEGELEPVDEAACAPHDMPQVLATLSRLSPLLKRPLLGACTDCVLNDGQVTVLEAELVRAIAESLDCPIPPLVADAA